VDGSGQAAHLGFFFGDDDFVTVFGELICGGEARRPPTKDCGFQCFGLLVWHVVSGLEKHYACHAMLHGGRCSLKS
jgi:hypothetical protein